MKAAVINGSARDGSNSDLLARVVVEGLPHEVVQLGIDKLPHIDDRRHANPSFGPVNAAYAAIMERILDCPVWVFASPVYWYGFSGIMKDFVDLWSHIMRVPEWQFQKRMAGKHAFLVLVGGDNPRLKALGLVQQFYWTADFMKMPFGGYVIGEGNRPGDVLQDMEALSQARALNRQVASLLG